MYINSHAGILHSEVLMKFSKDTIKQRLETIHPLSDKYVKTISEFAYFMEMISVNKSWGNALCT